MAVSVSVSNPKPSQRKFDFPNELRPQSIQESVTVWPTCAPLPKADVVVITWTSDETEGLSRVLAPDLGAKGKPPESRWFRYCRDWYLYWPTLQLHRLIQKESMASRGCPSLNLERPGLDTRVRGVLGTFVRTRIGELTVLLFHSQIHLNTDGRQLPLMNLVRQIIAESHPLLILSVGTAGGVSLDDYLGDVVVSNTAAFHLSDEFGDAAFNNFQYTASWNPLNHYQSVAETKSNMPLIYEPPFTAPTPQYAALMPEGGVNPSPPAGREHCVMRIASLPILTTDYFEFGTTTNGLNKIGAAVEMGDAAIAMACDQAGVPFGFVRNVSDPVINGDLDYDVQSFFATSTYQEVGVNTSMNGAVVIWALLAAESLDRLQSLAGSHAKVNVLEISPKPSVTPAPNPPMSPVQWGEDTPPVPKECPPESAAMNLWKRYTSKRKTQETFDRLPKADVVVLGWDADTWMSMQNVFCGSITDDEKWESQWNIDIRGFPETDYQRRLSRILESELMRPIRLYSDQTLDCWGRFRLVQIGAQVVLLYDTRVSLLHQDIGILTALLGRISDEANPSLVLSVGTGHATREDLNPGSVVITNRASFLLTGDLEGEKDNGLSFGSDWAPSTANLQKAIGRLRSISWPSLLPPTNSFTEVPAAGYQPPDPVPDVVIGPAFITAPRRVSMGFFDIPLFLTATAQAKLDELGWLVETVDAVVARHCQAHKLDCGFIRGVSMPLLTSTGESERATWARYLHGHFSQTAALNAVITACTVLY